MIPDSLISCGYLLLCSGCCINRLVNHSTKTFSTVLPQFVLASFGVAAIGARSFHGLIYNMFWRNYDIDPRLIAAELERVKYHENFIDLILSRGGIATLVYSLYYHYGFFSTGLFVVVCLTTIEVLLVKAKTAVIGERTPDLWKRFSANFREQSYPLVPIWILSNELFGWAVGNHLCRLANVPYSIATWAFPPEGFYQGWSIMNSINDYMMICYIILMTESLCT